MADTAKGETRARPPFGERKAVEHVRAVVRGARTSFFWAMRTLPVAEREAMFSIYAFCREVDDIADGAGKPDEKMGRLRGWREEIEGLYDDPPRVNGTFPTAQALLQPIARFGLRKEDFLALLDGVEMDATGPIRAPSLADFERYCDRVAGAVGRLSVCVFGEPGERGRRLARALGRALQITNILRDLHEDADVGRLYLPAELLEAHGIAHRDPRAVLAHPRLPHVCDDLVVLARQRFAEAHAILSERAHEGLRPAVIMMEVYRRILDRLVRRGWTHLDRRIRLPMIEKLWVLLRYGAW